MKLSVCMIVKNEEALLGRCLESVRDADEIVVCDTGSEDRTIAIAKMYTAKVFTDYTWNDNFAEARNHALNKCTGDWIFIIDADEFLEVGGIDRIKKFIENTEHRVVDIPSQNDGDKSVHWLPRLYVRNPEIFYRGAIHNHLSSLPTEKLNVMITYGYSPAHQKDPDRAFRILKKEVEAHPDCSREKFYLAREYWYRHDFETAIKWYDEYLAGKTKFWAEVGEALLTKARCLWFLQRGDEARDVCLQAIKLNANFQEALEFMAQMSGPGNRKRWLEFASTADNNGVLFIRPNNKPRVYFCSGMDFFGERMIRNYGFQRYHEDFDLYKNTFFEGLYFDKDYEVFSKHKGRTTVFWNGNDLERLLVNEAWQEIIRKKPWVVHLCHDKGQLEKLEFLGIKARVRPLFFSDLNRYQPSYQQSSHPRVYLNAHPGREAGYGIDYLLSFADRVREVEFHIYGITAPGTPIPANIIYHGQVSEELFDAETDSMQACLMLIKNTWISQTGIKAMLREQYVIAQYPVPCGVHARGTNELMNMLRLLAETTPSNQPGRKFYEDLFKDQFSRV